MKSKRLIIACLFALATVISYSQDFPTPPAPPAGADQGRPAPPPGFNDREKMLQAVKENYTKREVMIPMRDGVCLHTSIYEPKDNSTKHPILMERTSYGTGSGENYFPTGKLSESSHYGKAKYIIVYQDVRGRYLSEGEFVQVRPLNKNIKDRTSKKALKDKVNIDEATDTYDTIEWLIKNTNNNGNVGVSGVSLDGFYATMAASSAHPALKAVSPQAPVTDWFRGDDRHHNGAFTFLQTVNYLPAQEGERQGRGVTPLIVKNDVYQDYLKLGTFSDADKLIGTTVSMWNDIKKHPDFDEFWQERDARTSCYNLKPAMLIVGGTYDSEDCYGAWGTYEAIKTQSPETELYLAFGPWYHGGWSRRGYSSLGNVYFGEGSSDYYQDNIEYPFFRHYLEGEGDAPNKVNIYYSGSNKWEFYDNWPVKGIEFTPFYLHGDGSFNASAPVEAKSVTSYYSDLDHPVPFTGEPVKSRTTSYMTDDQRFAAARPDVITFCSDVLTDSLHLAGPIDVELFASMTGTDADFVVKVIDVYPDGFSYPREVSQKMNSRYNMSGYQMMVRGEVFRGRYREGFDNPKAFVPGEVTPVNFRLYDVAHTFAPGHKIMIQIHSTWFPLIDRNPQQFINTYEATKEDLKNETISVYHQSGAASRIILPIVK